MPIVLEPIVQGGAAASSLLSELNVVRVGVPAIDGCAFYDRLKVFIVQQGTRPVLEHVFRNRAGEAVNLLELTDVSDASESVSESGEAQVIVRSKELVAPTGGDNPLREISAAIYDPEAGVLRFRLDTKMAPVTGVYQLSWGLKNSAGEIFATNETLLFVERSLYAFTGVSTDYVSGPPSLEEIRLALLDHAGTNSMLSRVEFFDEQIADAIAWPVRQWNESPPPVLPLLDTRSFPFREAWLGAVCGRLLLAAAHNYRREHLAYAAGGITLDDKNKEREYLAAASQLLKEWEVFRTHKKYELNLKAAAGWLGSPYGGRSG